MCDSYFYARAEPPRHCNRAVCQSKHFSSLTENQALKQATQALQNSIFMFGYSYARDWS